MATATKTPNLNNPAHLREAGLNALQTALGPERAQAFIRLYEGDGDFIEEASGDPQLSLPDLIKEIRSACAEVQRCESHG